MLTAIVGINWGDEGKGRMVDLLGADYDVVIRYQGGNNAGHTVINERGKFILNLLPSGILRENTMNVCGNGMVIDAEHLAAEIERLARAGVSVTPENLKISDKAIICFPFHRLQDILEEDRLAERKAGSTRRGIAPVYSDKYMRKALRFGDLLYPDSLSQKLWDLVEWKNITLNGYGGDALDFDELSSWVERFCKPLVPFVSDTVSYLSAAVGEGKKILFEAQLGALRDIDFGIYPFASSSSTIAAYAPIGSGLPFVKLDETIGIMKAYSSCVGGGPFVAELGGEEASRLREAGGEYGAATGRPRRVGGFDVPASRYGCRVQGADYIALTKLDVLSYMEKIPVCAAYEVDGKRTEAFPDTDSLFRAKPVYEYFDGFMTDISKCRRPEDLPENALKYVKYLEETVGTRIRYVSVGPERGDYIEFGK